MHLERLVSLRRAGTISNCFPVANGRVVGRFRLLQGHGRLLVIVEPVHPYADFGGTRQAPNLFEFFAAPGAVEPCVDPVQSDFAARSHDLPDSICNIAGAIAELRETRGAGPSEFRPGQFLKGITKNVEQSPFSNSR